MGNLPRRSSPKFPDPIFFPTLLGGEKEREEKSWTDETSAREGCPGV